MIKMTRNITRFKITSDLQIKHELASNKKLYIRTTTPGLAKVKIIQILTNKSNFVSQLQILRLIR